MDIFQVLEAAPETDPLSETTRHQRRSLLGSCLVAIAVTAGGLVPKEISALGVELEAKEQTGLLVLLCLVVIYFLSAFLTYALPEWRRFEARHQLFRQRVADFVKPYVGVTQDKASDARLLEGAIIAAGHAKLAGTFAGGAPARIIVDIWFPIAVAVTSVTFIIGALLGLPVFTREHPFLSPLIWSLLAVTAVLVAAVFVRWRRKTREQRPLRGIQKVTEEVRQLTEEMRAATAHPEGSPEREAAKKRIEEKLREISKRRPKPGDEK